jgi:hypothetical protein
MAYIYFHVFTPFIGLTVSIITQFVGLRSFAKISFYKSVFVGLIFGLLSVIGLEVYFFIIENRDAIDLVAISIVNIFCFIVMQSCFFLIINTGVSALRVRFLDELSRAEKGLTVEEIIERYNPKEITQKRIEKLSAAKQIFCKENRYFVNRGLILLVAKVFDNMKFLIFGKRFQRTKKIDWEN